VTLFAQTLPFALVAAFFPPGLAAVIWLLALPQGRARALTYLIGAATSTVGSGVAILLLLEGTGAVPDGHPGIVAGARMTVGTMLLVFGVLVAVRKSAPGTSQNWGARRPTRPHFGWIFVLGVVMWTPSFTYLAALELIADNHLGPIGKAVHLFLVDGVVLLMVEVPLIVQAVAPRWAGRQLHVASERICLYTRPIAVLFASGGGLFLIATGLSELV